MALQYFSPFTRGRSKNVSVDDPVKPRPRMGRRKLKMEWYAAGYDPEGRLEENDFQLAIEQTAPTFNVRRLDNGVIGVMHGVDSLTTTVVPGCKTRRTTVKQLSEKILLRWRDVLSGERPMGYHVVGTCVQTKEARVWLYHSGATMLFILGFSTKTDNWLEDPVYKFEEPS